MQTHEVIHFIVVQTCFLIICMWIFLECTIDNICQACKSNITFSIIQRTWTLVNVQVDKEIKKANGHNDAETSELLHGF